MKKILGSFVFLNIILSLLLANNLLFISSHELTMAERKYGLKAKKRLQLWDRMLQKAQTKNTLQKLKIVNDFFNQIQYKQDTLHWKKKDYWASPLEFLGTGAGDSEDYAIAKYFSLRKLGIADKKLKMTYVILSNNERKYEKTHMVLNYYHEPNLSPIVLDHVNKKLVLGKKRKDLKPVYAFNAAGLWKAQTKNLLHNKHTQKALQHSWKNLLSKSI